MPRAAVFCLGAALSLAACSSPRQAQPAQAAPATVAAAPAAAPDLPIGQMPQIDINAVLADTKALASDEFDGRAPGTRGEELSVSHIVNEFRTIGLKAGNTDGTYIQRVPLVGITPTPAPLVARKGGQEMTLKYKDEIVAWSRRVAETSALTDSEMVFVGYGVVAPEYNWDDYKGVDVKGKTIVMLINDPPVPDPTDPSKLDPKTFGGRAMTYYGRWTYKFDMAAQKGAAGAIIIHETEPAGYPFNVVQGNVNERFDLVAPDKNMGRAAIESWVTLDVGRALLKMGGQDFDALKKLAATREFRPVPLGVTASMTLHSRLRTVSSRNVLGRLDGSDPKLKNEYVIYSAHWDHLGEGIPVKGDRIYNGAVDDGLGVAGVLAIAQAFKKLPAPPKRSIVFLLVTAEEQGLLGSEYYVRHPIYPLAKTLADINIDEMNPHGRTRDLPINGFGQSDLEEYLAAAAAEQGRVVKGDVEPEKGYYYRADHFSFAKAGVPALYPDFARETDFFGKPPEYGPKEVQDFTEHIYHQPTDEVKPDWDLTGVREDLQVLFAVGYRVAEADNYPQWKAGSEFRAAREAMLATVDRN